MLRDLYRELEFFSISGIEAGRVPRGKDYRSLLTEEEVAEYIASHPAGHSRSGGCGRGNWPRLARANESRGFAFEIPARSSRCWPTRATPKIAHDMKRDPRGSSKQTSKARDSGTM